MDHLMITNRRNPFKIFILAFLTVAVVSNFITGAKPGSAAALMPGWWWTGWLIGVLVGSVVCLYGCFARNLTKGIQLERAAIPLVAVSIAAYSAAAMLYGGASSVTGGCILLGISGAFVARHRELTKILQEIPKKE